MFDSQIEESICYSKRTTCLLLIKDNQFVAQKGQHLSCPKEATYLLLKMANLFVTQKVKPFCWSKRVVCLLLNANSGQYSNIDNTCTSGKS